MKAVAQPCVRCSGAEILVGEGARIAINGNLDGRRFFVRTTATTAAPYR